MKPYAAPVDDILFSLNEVADAGALADWDSELCAEVLGHFASFAQDKIAPLDETGDLQGCRLESGAVYMPDGFVAAFVALKEGGWQGLTAPEIYGGLGQSKLVAGAVSEVFSGANHSLQMVCNLVPGAISTLLRYGTETQQQQWIPRLAAGDALSTMCLTEPDAGSDLSRIRTKAMHSNAGWQISGEKIYISGGDQDMSADVLHLVLARSGEAGIRGLSLFLCAKSEVGSAIRVTRLENKLGLHASPTCQLVFENAPAQLIGEEGAGLAAMFTLMNHARIDVALQGVAHAARAYDISLSYASQRVQGRKRDGTEALLTDHADVRRMLDEQQSLALGARAMAHITLVELERGGQPALVEFLTPLCKVFCTEAGIRSADLGIQVLGGYGYLNEYRVAQTWRDARITAIYEGANGIHELAIATRGIRVQEGAGADGFEALVAKLAGGHTAVLAHLDDWREVRQQMLSLEDPSQRAHEFAQLTGELFFKAVWVRIASLRQDEDTARLFETVLKR